MCECVLRIHNLGLALIYKEWVMSGVIPQLSCSPFQLRCTEEMREQVSRVFLMQVLSACYGCEAELIVSSWRGAVWHIGSYAYQDICEPLPVICSILGTSSLQLTNYQRTDQ